MNTQHDKWDDYMNVLDDLHDVAATLENDMSENRDYGLASMAAGIVRQTGQLGRQIITLRTRKETER